MLTVIAIGVAIIAVEVGIAMAFCVAAFIAIKHAAQAAESLAYRVEGEVDHVSEMMKWRMTVSDH